MTETTESQSDWERKLEQRQDNAKLLAETEAEATGKFLAVAVRRFTVQVGIGPGFRVKALEEADQDDINTLLDYAAEDGQRLEQIKGDCYYFTPIEGDS